MTHPVLLVVDDDAAVLGALGRDLLQRYGERFRVVRLGGGAVALQELQKLKLRGARVALLLVDQRMPGMPGLELLSHARRIYPDAKRVLLTAYADMDAAITAINDVGLDHFLLKPWDPPGEKLYPVLDDLLGDWEANAVPATAGVRVVSSRWSAEGHHVRDFFERNLIPYRWLDLETDDEAGAVLAAARAVLGTAGAGRDPAMPLVVFEDGSVLEQPSDTQVAARIGLSTQARTERYDVVIAGAGPAGLAAAVHAAAEGHRTLVIEQHAPGGQAGLSARIENYLGFPVGLSGGDLARRALAQAKRFGAEIISPVEVQRLRLDAGYPVLELSSGSQVSARALLIATGVQYRRVDVPGIERLVGAGVYYGGALTEAMRIAGRDVHVLGGGNSAAQAALHLARFARSVTLLVRQQQLSGTMSRYLRERIAQAPGIHVRTGCSLEAVEGDAWLKTLVLRDAMAGGTELVPAFALFVFIGASTRTQWTDGVLRRDARGFIYSGADVMRGSSRPAGWAAARDPFLLETNVAGVFVAGDVRHGLARGVAAAVGEGNLAAQLMHQHLNGVALRSKRPEPVTASA
jgi:thioredoxin reductase (NADPH)